MLNAVLRAKVRATTRPKESCSLREDHGRISNTKTTRHPDRKRLDDNSRPWLIHVGKSGGTTVSSVTKLEHLHRKPPTGRRKLILWLRNPISRFVSAFYFSKGMVEKGKKVGEMSESAIKNLSLDNCPYPEKMKQKWRSKSRYMISETADKLFDMFPNVNALLEALSSTNVAHRKSAERLMAYTHSGEGFNFFKSLGWYLDNGKWVPGNSHRVIFVGTLENIDEDLRSIQRILKQPELATAPAIRQHKGFDVTVSRKGLSNLISYLEESDYRALRCLVQAKLIPRKLYRSYREYEHVRD